MHKLKYLIEQRNLSKINFGNAPNALFKFAIANGGRAFTVKTVRPQVPDMTRDIIQTVANSNTVGTRSGYAKDHVFIISKDLKSNVNKDVRNVVVIPLPRFEMLTKTATNKTGFEETYPDYNVLEKTNHKIGTSPVIYEEDFNKAVNDFKTWLSQSDELRLANEKVKQLTADLEAALKVKPKDDTEEEEEEKDDEEETKPEEDISKIKIYFPKWDVAAKKAVGDPVGFNKDLFFELLGSKDRIDLSSYAGGEGPGVYYYQQLLKQVAKHPDFQDPDDKIGAAATIFAKIPDSDFGTWGTRSKAFLAALNTELSESSADDAPSIAKQYNIDATKVGDIITKGLIDLIIDELVKRKIGFVIESKFIKLKSLVEQFHRVKKDTTNQNNTNLNQNTIKKDDTKLKQNTIKKDDTKKDDTKKDDTKKKNDSLIRLSNGYLWVNTYADTSNSPKFSSKILLKTTYSWPALKKLVYGKQIKVRGTKGLKKVNDSYRMYLYDDVSPYWIDDSGNVDTGTFDRNHTRWYYPNAKDGIKLTGIIKDVRIIRLPNNRAASYFYIVDGDSDGWIPSNFVSIA